MQRSERSAQACSVSSLWTFADRRAVSNNDFFSGQRGVTVVSAEFVLTGILRQKLQPDLFRLFSSPEVESSPTATPAKPRVSMETRSGRANRSSSKRLTRASAGKRKTRSGS